MSELDSFADNLFWSRAANMHTCIPARIEKYDHATQKATVKPLLNRRIRTATGFEPEEIQPIPSVPVVWPRSGGASLTFPVAQGDGCLLLFSERSMDLWLSEGGVVTPDDPRKFALSDAICLLGLQPFVGGDYPEDNENVRLQYGDAQLVINNDNKLALGNGAAELLDLFDQLLQALITTTTITAVGNQPLSAVPDFTQIKALLAEIKGEL